MQLKLYIKLDAVLYYTMYCRFLCLVGCLSTIYIISALHLSHISAMCSYLDQKCGILMMLYCPSSGKFGAVPKWL